MSNGRRFPTAKQVSNSQLFSVKAKTLENIEYAAEQQLILRDLEERASHIEEEISAFALDDLHNRIDQSMEDVQSIQMYLSETKADLHNKTSEGLLARHVMLRRGVVRLETNLAQMGASLGTLKNTVDKLYHEAQAFHDELHHCQPASEVPHADFLFDGQSQEGDDQTLTPDDLNFGPSDENQEVPEESKPGFMVFEPPSQSGFFDPGSDNQGDLNFGDDSDHKQSFR